MPVWEIFLIAGAAFLSILASIALVSAAILRGRTGGNDAKHE